MAIKNSVLPASQLNLVTVPIDKTYAITTILVCNHALTGSATFNLHLITSGNAIGNDNIIVSNLELPAGETFTFDSEKIVLDQGDYIAFSASPDNGTGNTDLTATVSYLEV
jgi:hypothetical protein